MLVKYISFSNQLSKIFPKHCAMFHHSDAKTIFWSAVTSVQPTKLIESNVKIEENNLIVQNKSFPIKRPCYLVGFGKAVLGMATEMERILGTNLKEGIVIIPEGILECFRNNPLMQTAPNSKIQYVEGSPNNLPDEKALIGANKIKTLCNALHEDDLLIVLISGGGSALLPLPKGEIKLEEKLWLIKALANSGANILELNSVRKRISQLKGGGLVNFAYPCKVISLILSDVIGDPLDFIASGPTVQNFDERCLAVKILKKYNLDDKIPQSISNAIKNKDEEVVRNYDHVCNFIVGNNKLACSSAKKTAETLGYESLILSTTIEGDVNKISRMYAKLAAEISNLLINKSQLENLNIILKEFQSEFPDLNVNDVVNLSFKSKVCIIGGGEPTVVVKGGGKGGRNQQLALLFSKEIVPFNTQTDVTFLSCGTDGIDGPTDVAGAIGDNLLPLVAMKENLIIDDYLNDNDCYGFYEKFLGGKYLVKTGHTGTNVMDMHLLFIESTEKSTTRNSCNSGY